MERAYLAWIAIALLLIDGFVTAKGSAVSAFHRLETIDSNVRKIVSQNPKKEREGTQLLVNGSVENVDPLLLFMPLLSHKDPAYRQAAIIALGRGGKRSLKAVPTLTAMSKHENIQMCILIAMALWRIDSTNPHYMLLLGKAIGEPTSSNTYKAALVALESIASVEHWDLCFPGDAKDTNPFFAHANKIIPGIIRGMECDDKTIEQSAIQVLLFTSVHSTQMLDILRKKLHSKDALIRIKALQIIYGFKRNASAAIPDIIPLSKDSCARVRSEAISAWREIDENDPRLPQALCDALSDSTSTVRYTAAICIYYLPEKAFLTIRRFVSKKIGSITDKDVRKVLFAALGQSGNEKGK